jgi:hypothetical protein
MVRIPKKELKEIREKINEAHPDMKIVVPQHFVNEDKNERTFAEVWTVIPIEGYCVVDMDWKRKREKYDYLMGDSDDPKEWEKVPNPDYDPDVKRNELPEFCKKKICFRCLEKGCEYFAYAECTDTEEVAKIHSFKKEG